MTFEELQQANAAIKTTPIKGKDYAEVNQRIKAFRMCYPEGFIRTILVSNENGVCVFQAEVGNNTEEGEILLGMGTAYEKEGSSFINSTSYIENCETSAVGRALGMAGFGIDTSIASYEEVSNAIANQEKKASPEQIKIISEAYKDKEDKLQALFKKQGISSLEELSMAKAVTLIQKIKKSHENVTEAEERAYDSAYD